MTLAIYSVYKLINSQPENFKKNLGRKIFFFSFDTVASVSTLGIGTIIVLASLGFIPTGPLNAMTSLYFGVGIGVTTLPIFVMGADGVAIIIFVFLRTPSQNQEEMSLELEESTTFEESRKEEPQVVGTNQEYALYVEMVRCAEPAYAELKKNSKRYNHTKKLTLYNNFFNLGLRALIEFQEFERAKNLFNLAVRVSFLVPENLRAGWWRESITQLEKEKRKHFEKDYFTAFDEMIAIFRNTDKIEQ